MPHEIYSTHTIMIKMTSYSGTLCNTISIQNNSYNSLQYLYQQCILHNIYSEYQIYIHNTRHPSQTAEDVFTFESSENIQWSTVLFLMGCWKRRKTRCSPAEPERERLDNPVETLVRDAPGAHVVPSYSTPGRTRRMPTDGSSPDAAGSFVVRHRGVLAVTRSRAWTRH